MDTGLQGDEWKFPVANGPAQKRTKAKSNRQQFANGFFSVWRESRAAARLSGSSDELHGTQRAFFTCARLPSHHFPPARFAALVVREAHGFGFAHVHQRVRQERPSERVPACVVLYVGSMARRCCCAAYGDATRVAVPVAACEGMGEKPDPRSVPSGEPFHRAETHGYLPSKKLFPPKCSGAGASGQRWRSSADACVPGGCCCIGLARCQGYPVMSAVVHRDDPHE